MKNKIDLIRTIASGCIALAGFIILIVGFIYIKNEALYNSGVVHIIVGAALLTISLILLIVFLILWLRKRNINV